MCHKLIPRTATKRIAAKKLITRNGQYDQYREDEEGHPSTAKKIIAANKEDEDIHHIIISYRYMKYMLWSKQIRWYLKLDWRIKNNIKLVIQLRGSVQGR